MTKSSGKKDSDITLNAAKRRIAELEKELAQRKISEDALAEAGLRYRALVEQAADVVLVFDESDGALHVFNDKACQEIGYSREELKKMTLSDLEAKENPNDIRKHFNLIIRKGEDTFETLIRRKDGQVRPYWVNTRSITVGGKNYIQAIVRDITERNKLQEELLFVQARLNQAQEIARVGSWDIDIQTGQVYQSEGLYRLFGLEPKPEVVDGDIILKHIHPDDRSVFEAFMRETFDEVKFGRLEVRFQSRNGRLRHALVEVRVIRDAKGKPSRLSGMMKDITDFKENVRELLKKEQELTDQAASLREMNVALKVLLGHLEKEKEELQSRVINNVRRLVFPSLDKLKRLARDAEQSTLLDIMESNLEQITSGFSAKLSSGLFNLTQRELEVANLVREGMSTSEIATLLSVSENAVVFHRSNIRKKIGLKRRSENLQTALRNME